MKRKIGILFAYLVIVFFVFSPETVCQGAKTGLLLWFQTVLPALLPFMIVSGFFVKKNITDSINKMAAPFFTEMFHISRLRHLIRLWSVCFPGIRSEQKQLRKCMKKNSLIKQKHNICFVFVIMQVRCFWLNLLESSVCTCLFLSRFWCWSIQPDI